MTTALRLQPHEAHAWSERGFFVRESVFQPHELEDLRAAAFRVALDKIARSYLDLGVFP